MCDSLKLIIFAPIFTESSVVQLSHRLTSSPPSWIKQNVNKLKKGDTVSLIHVFKSIVTSKRSVKKDNDPDGEIEVDEINGLVAKEDNYVLYGPQPVASTSYIDNEVTKWTCFPGTGNVVTDETYGMSSSVRMVVRWTEDSNFLRQKDSNLSLFDDENDSNIDTDDDENEESTDGDST